MALCGMVICGDLTISGLKIVAFLRTRHIHIAHVDPPVRRDVNVDRFSVYGWPWRVTGSDSLCGVAFHTLHWGPWFQWGKLRSKTGWHIWAFFFFLRLGRAKEGLVFLLIVALLRRGLLIIQQPSPLLLDYRHNESVQFSKFTSFVLATRYPIMNSSHEIWNANVFALRPVSLLLSKYFAFTFLYQELHIPPHFQSR